MRWAIPVLCLIGCQEQSKLSTEGALCFDGPNLVGECRPGTIRTTETGTVCEGQVLAQKEDCSPKDLDCSGSPYDIPNDLCGSDVGECVKGRMFCIDGVEKCVGGIKPTEETCNSADDDCNGIIDDADQIPIELCYNGNTEDLLHPPCRPGITRCVRGRMECYGEVLPESERCNEIDSDCNGQVDDTGITESDNVDIVFLIDRSCSMGLPMRQVRLALTQFADKHQNEPYKYWIVDIPSRVLGIHDANSECFGCGHATFVSAVANLTTNHPGVENTYDAAYGIHTGNPEVIWSENSARFVVLFSDEPAQTTMGLTLGDIINTWPEGIKFYGYLSATNVSHNVPDWQPLADYTSGATFDLYANSIDIELNFSQTLKPVCQE